MGRKLGGLIGLTLLAPFVALGQHTFSGPPTEDDYLFMCKNYGSRGEPMRDRCESEVRVKRGLGTCADVAWKSHCSEDSMTDRTNCTVTSPGSDLFVFSEKGTVTFSVTGDDYPGEPTSIRIDKNPAVKYVGDSTTSQDAMILKQLKTGRVVMTRYIRWPSGISEDTTAPICDLPDRIAEAQAQSR